MSQPRSLPSKLKSFSLFHFPLTFHATQTTYTLSTTWLIKGNERTRLIDPVLTLINLRKMKEEIKREIEWYKGKVWWRIERTPGKVEESIKIEVIVYNSCDSYEGSKRKVVYVLEMVLNRERGSKRGAKRLPHSFGLKWKAVIVITSIRENRLFIVRVKSITFTKYFHLSYQSKCLFIQSFNPIPYQPFHLWNRLGSIC